MLSYGTSLTDVITSDNFITDFEVGTDKLGLIGFDVLDGFDVDLVQDRALIQQEVDGVDLTVSLSDGDGGFSLLATLHGVASNLGLVVDGIVGAGAGLNILDNFLITTPVKASRANQMTPSSLAPKATTI